MFSIIDIINLVKTEFPEITFYPLSFPINSPDNAVTVNAYGSSIFRAGNYNLEVQFIVRGVHPSEAEKTSLAIRKFLEAKTEFPLGTAQVVLVKSNNPFPFYMGNDETGNYLYSNNFRFIVNEGV